MSDDPTIKKDESAVEIQKETPTEQWQADLLPSSILTTSHTHKNTKYHIGLNWVPIYCANCGADGGWVPEDTANFAFYLCQPCADKWAPIAGFYIEPDAVFWEKVKKAQIEKEGRELTGAEVAECLKDDTHYLSKLAKDRPKVSKK